VRPEQFFLPVMVIIGLAIVMPATNHFLGTMSDFPAHLQFLASLVIPLLVIFTGASWLG